MKKITFLFLLLLSGCSRSSETNIPIKTEPQYNCRESDYGNGVYFVTGDDFGVCLSRFMGGHTQGYASATLSMAPLVASDRDNNYVVGYYVVLR